MKDGLEHSIIHTLMGPSVAYMEDYVRTETNRAGFCGRHYKALYESKNRLGLALMVHTHLMDINQHLRRHGPKSFKHLQEIEAACYICDMAEKSFARYLDTFFWLFAKEEKVRQSLQTSNGCCLPHLAEVYAMAPKKLSGANLRLFYDVLFEVQQAQMDKLDKDLEWFAKKFDYRYKDESWRDSKDAIERAVERLTGIKLGEREKE